VVSRTLGGRGTPPSNPARLNAFYERLVAGGKPKQVTLTARMHNRLTILRAVLRECTPWTPGHATVFP
jgi:hypothetical protein